MGLLVSDLDKSIDFYQRVLGLVTQHVADGYAEFNLGSGHRLILEDCGVLGPSPHQFGRLGHIALLYPSRGSLGATVRRVATRGDTLINEAIDHGISGSVYLSDPDGNGIELYYDRLVAEWPRTAEEHPDPAGIWFLNIEDLMRNADVEESYPLIGHLNLVVSNLEDTIDLFVDLLQLSVNLRTAQAVYGTWRGYHHDLSFRYVAGVSSDWLPSCAGLKAFTVSGFEKSQMEDILTNLHESSYSRQVLSDGVQLKTFDGVTVRLLQAES
ncbi:hypothetical protein GCM10027423_52310 [Spirosoma arcticum]